MKRAVFIVLIVALFVCSEAVTLLATRAATSNLPVKAESIGFYYKMDANARYLDLKTQWQATHRGELKLEEAASLADEAFQKASVESPFDKWLFHGGPSPQVFKGKLHIYNTSKNALLELPLYVTVRAQVGELRVNPEIQMTDFDHLRATASWQIVSEDTVKVAALAPGEDMLVDIMQFKLLEFLKNHPNQWPTRIEVLVTSPRLGTSRQSLDLIPDHFVIPVLY